MEAIKNVYALPFIVLRPPNLKLKLPSISAPSPMTTFAIVMLTYFLFTGGLIYDMINEPPSMGQTVDAQGRYHPTVFMEGRINSQYIMEGLSSSFLFCLGAFGLIALDTANSSKNNYTPTNRLALIGFGFGAFVIAYLATRLFIGIKVHGYLVY